MSIPGSLLDSVLKYRKQKQRPGGPGAPRYAGQCDFARPVTRVPGSGRGAISGGPVPRPEVYGDDSPGEYVPHVGFMEIPEPDYGPYEASLDQAPRAPAPQGFGGSRPDFDQPEVEYADCLMTPELFERLMSLAGRDESTRLDPQQIAELKADLIGRALDLEELTDRLIGDLAPEASFSADPIDAGVQYDDMDRPATTGHPLSQTDYAAADPQDFFEQQMQAFENQFHQFEALQFDQGSPMEAIFHSQEALFDISQLAALPPEPAMPGSESLDDIIEVHDLIESTPPPGYGPDVPAYDDCLMTPGLFGELMHEAAIGMAPQEAAPVPYDIGMMPGGMYGEPMPYDMMDPGMMPGPMGPGFGPELPPGP